MELFNGHPLPGSPRGVWEPISEKRSVARYHVTPAEYKGGSQAVILLYDMYELSNDNPKYLADMYAEYLGIPVIVPDYRPKPIKPLPYNWADRSRSFLRRIVDFFLELKLMWTEFVPAAGLESEDIRYGRIRACLQEIALEHSYSDLRILGYSVGADLAARLLADPDPTLATAIKSGALLFPENINGEDVRRILKPTCWHMRSTVLYKSPCPDLLSALREEQSKSAVMELHALDDQPHGLWGLPYFFLDASADHFKLNKSIFGGQ